MVADSGQSHQRNCRYHMTMCTLPLPLASTVQQTWYNAAKKVTRTKLHRLVLYLVSDMWFWGIVIKLSGFLACDYTTSSQPYMKQVPTEMCLRGDRGITYGLVASFGLMYYVFTSFCYTNMQVSTAHAESLDKDITAHTITSTDASARMHVRTNVRTRKNFRICAHKWRSTIWDDTQTHSVRSGVRSSRISTYSLTTSSLDWSG